MARLRLSEKYTSVDVNERRIRLSPLEFALLKVLIRNHPRVVSYERLSTQVWGSSDIASKKWLKQYIHYLRSKLEDDPKSPRLIINQRKYGYRIELGP